jgi:Ca2+-binding EF-hand superfamily protein
MKAQVIVPLLGTLALALTALPATADCGHGHGKRPSFEELDQDKSGTLTQDEFVAAATARATERFNRLDENRDGVVTQEELAAAKARWKTRHEQHEAE